MSPAPLSDFSQDRLSREPLADYLTHFITTSQPTTNEHSRVIALDSGWGTGKTSFVNMWMKKLEDADTSSFACLKYNAWENDDSPDALMPIICSFQQLIDESTDKGKQQAKDLRKIITTFGSEAIGIASQCFVGANLVAAGERAYQRYKNDKYPNRIFETYMDRQKNKDLFKKFADGVRGEHPYLLICIDELDRCRPTFAIETLEVVKHFFDLENVIFVFSLDMKQLQHSIKTIYGDIDSIGYLQRFFDYQISLPEPDLELFLQERLTLDDKHLLSVEAELLGKLAKRFSISLRTLCVICEEYLRFYRKKEGITKLGTRKEYQKTYLTLFALKYARPFEYLSLLQNGTSIENRDDAVWIEIFGFRDSTLDEYQSCYTEKVAKTTLSVIFSSNKDHQFYSHVIEHFIHRDADIDDCATTTNLDIPLSTVIYNNVEYGCMFLPISSKLNPKK
ncbi:MAG TPA: P-loop NTPase fold protein [Methanocorpusculum sp.]|nr:P-loop NTPase fold protein [Methanocorpusculum sp.]HJK80807.1 P-loop NTPase fold protein [Methanocorpusculum sp.]